MKYIYLVTGPMDNPIHSMEKLRAEGFEPVLVTDGVTLRGRECGQVILEGDYMKRWNIQEILESIEDFEDICKSKQNIENNNNSEEFYDYGIE